MNIKRTFAIAGLICYATSATVLGAQPFGPEPPAPPVKASKPEGISPYRLNPGIQPDTVYVPASEGAVYVDPDGDDANHGMTEAKPVRSLAVAYSRLASRHALLLKRGSIHSGTLPRWTYSNKILGAYGSGAKPIVRTGGRNFLYKYGVAALSNITIRDIVFDNEDHSGNLLVWIGGGQGILIENCEFLSGGLVIQKLMPRERTDLIELKNVKLLRNQVIRAWNVAGAAHASGLFAQGIDGLEIIGNTFDHNGWNPAKPGGQATMFNHNLYLSHVSNVVVKDNDIRRAASAGIKFRSDVPEGSREIVIEGNRFYEGELGISIGGNTSEPNRFRNVRITGNVFDRLGASQPTKRSFAWGIDVVDNADTVVKDNLFTNLPAFPNKFLVRVTGSRERVLVEQNLSRP